MKIVTMKDWENFETTIQSVYNELEELKVKKHPLHVSNLLFRGHNEASWELETTLDRVAKRPYKMRDYHRVIRGVRPAVVSITGHPWTVPDNWDVDESIPGAPPGYNFMVYLRHHGFPSPLLDWSRSPYVAAFFAFRSSGNPSEEHAAIYSYVEYLGGAKGGWVGDPTIFGLGPYVVSHKRHYSQQCEYTICTKNTDDGYAYCRHEDAISKEVAGQDQLVKYMLPKTERSKVLRRLEIMNITAFSLFGSEESLMDTLAYQEIEKALLNQERATE